MSIDINLTPALLKNNKMMIIYNLLKNIGWRLFLCLKKKKISSKRRNVINYFCHLSPVGFRQFFVKVFLQFTSFLITLAKFLLTSPSIIFNITNFFSSHTLCFPKYLFSNIYPLSILIEAINSWTLKLFLINYHQLIQTKIYIANHFDGNFSQTPQPYENRKTKKEIEIFN